MHEFKLYIGNKATSSWSLRGWLACKLAGIDFDEITIPLDTPETRASISRVSPSGRVPCLHHGERRIWESIAIGEYLAELHPERRLWPSEPAARAHARGVCDGDVLPACRIGDAGLPSVRLSLDVMQLGGSGSGPSWAVRVLRLRDSLGPFRLAYLEALVRAADVRATRKEASR